MDQILTKSEGNTIPWLKSPLLGTRLKSRGVYSHMKNAHLLTFLFLVLAGTLSGQAYFTAAGLRFGDGVGLTLQQRITKKSTIEGTLQGRLGEDQVRLTGLYERHFPIITRNFNIYLGAGLYKDWEQDTYLEVMPDPFGLAFVGGAELTLGRLNFSVDFRPAYPTLRTIRFQF
jgi:hypothetical protein